MLRPVNAFREATGPGIIVARRSETRPFDPRRDPP